MFDHEKVKHIHRIPLQNFVEPLPPGSSSFNSLKAKVAIVYKPIIFPTNQLSDFYIMASLAFNELVHVRLLAYKFTVRIKPET